MKTGGWVGFRDTGWVIYDGVNKWSRLKKQGWQIWVDAIIIWPRSSNDNEDTNNDKRDQQRQ